MAIHLVIHHEVPITYTIKKGGIAKWKSSEIKMPIR